MAFPFSSWFKGKQAPAKTEPAAEQAPTPVPRANPAPSATSASMRNSQRIFTSSMRAANPVPGSLQTQPVKLAAIRSVVPNSGQPPAKLRESPAPPRPGAPGIRPAVGGVPVAPAKVSPVMPTARTISFGGGTGSPRPSTPTFPAPRPETKPAAPAPTGPEFVVELTVGDFVDRVPPGLLNAGPYPREQSVKFLSSEFYSDLSKGRASVPASVIYSKCPAIFARPISETEDAEVPLPLQKIVGQVSAALQTRPDQFREETGAEIETPFLQVAKEDNARLPKAAGTTVGVLPGSEPRAVAAELPASVSRSGVRRSGPISPLPSIKSAGDNAPTFAPPTAGFAGAINPGKRPPSTVRASVAGGKIRLSEPASPVRNMVPTAQQPVANPPPAPAHESARPPASLPSHQVAKKTARIQIPPVSLRPPGAAGPRPPVAFNPPAPQSAPPGTTPAIPPLRASPPQETKMPNFRPAPPTPVPTRRIPATFGATLQPSLPPPAFPATPPASAPLPVTPPAPALLAPAPVPVPASDRQISLGLAAILRGVPSSSLSVNPSSIADDERITLPFGPIEAQLSQGKVSVPKSVFIEALPEARRQIFAGDDSLEEIPISLQEVFQNLPANALAIRSDQLVEETNQVYATPFSQKAAEDAERLGFVEPVKPVASLPPEMPALPAVELEAPAAPPVDLVNVDENPSPLTIPVEVSSPAVVDDPQTAVGDSASPFVDTPDERSPASFDALPRLEAAFTTPEVHTESAPESVLANPAEVPLAADAPPVGNFLHDQAIAAGLDTAKLPLPELISAMPLHLELPAPPTELLLLDEQPTADSPDERSASLAETLVEGEPHSEALAGQLPEEVSFASTLPTPVELGDHAESLAFNADEASAFTVPSEPLPSQEAVHSSKLSTPPIADSRMQELFMSEEDMDAKTIVRHICQLPCVDACAIMFADGLPLAGNFPEAYEKAGFSAMAPSFFGRAMTFTEEVKLGRLEAYTLYLDTGLLSFFMCGGIGLSVRHTGRGFMPGVREKLGAVTRELASIYSSAKPVAPLPVV